MTKVLVVDDEQEIRKLSEEILRSVGYDVSSCDSVKSALEYLKQNKVEVIVSDFNMPDGTGTELFDTIDNPEYQRDGIRKVLVTANLKEDIPKENYHAFVKKPYTIEDLLNAI